MSPLAPDEIPVPPKQGLGLHDEATSTTSVHEPIQPGEQGSKLRLQVGRTTWGQRPTPRPCALLNCLLPLIACGTPPTDY